MCDSSGGKECVLNKDDKHIVLWLIRHGETASNEKKRYAGLGIDEPLSEGGKEKIKSIKAGIEPERIYTGPMLRCRQTAAILFPERELLTADGMTEIDFGLWEGKGYKELNGDSAYQAWIDSGGTAAIPGGEDKESFINRTMISFRRLLGSLEDCGSAALICHGGNIMAIMSSLTKEDYYSFQVKCGEGYKLEFKPEGEEIHDLSYHSVSAGFYT